MKCRDSASNSEIVIPMHRHGELFGVLDIDSPLPDRFREEDEEGLAGLVRIIEEKADARRKFEERIANAQSLKENGVPIDVIAKSLSLTDDELSQI